MVGFDPDHAFDSDVPVLSPCAVSPRSRGSSMSASTPGLELNMGGPLAAVGVALAGQRQNSTDSLSSELAYSPFPDLPPILTMPPLPIPPLSAGRHRASPPSPKLSSSLSTTSIELPKSLREKLQSTPTAELGPFEYPDPEPDTPAAKRAATGPVPALPSSQTYVTPPNIPLALGGALLGSLERGPRRSEPTRTPTLNVHPHSNSQRALRRRGSIASGQIPRLAAMLDELNSHNPADNNNLANGGSSHGTTRRGSQGAHRTPTSQVHTHDSPSGPAQVTVADRDGSADARGHSRTASSSNPMPPKSRTSSGSAVASKSPPTQPQRLVPTQPRRGGQVAFAHAPLPTVIPPSLLARRGSLPMIFAPTSSPTGGTSPLPGVPRVNGDQGVAEPFPYAVLKRPPTRPLVRPSFTD